MTELTMESLKQQRAKLKRQRRELSAKDQRFASRRLLSRLNQHRAFHQAKTIGSYVATNGEVNLAGLSLGARQSLCLPALQELVRPWRGRGLLFGQASKKLHKNPYGILEPRSGQYLEALDLDYLLIPLVGFDRSGNRLGMGGGYYDRALANRAPASQRRQYGKRTFLMGVAYAFQEIDKLNPRPWDIPLDGIVTEHELLLIDA